MRLRLSCLTRRHQRPRPLILLQRLPMRLLRPQLLRIYCSAFSWTRTCSDAFTPARIPRAGLRRRCRRALLRRRGFPPALDLTTADPKATAVSESAPEAVSASVPDSPAEPSDDLVARMEAAAARMDGSRRAIGQRRWQEGPCLARQKTPEGPDAPRRATASARNTDPDVSTLPQEPTKPILQQ